MNYLQKLNNKNRPFLLFFPNFSTFLAFVCPHNLLGDACLLLCNLLRDLFLLFLLPYRPFYHLPCVQSIPAMIIFAGSLITQQMISASPDLRRDRFHEFRHLILVLLEYLPDPLALYHCLVMQEFTVLIRTHNVVFAIVWHLAIILLYCIIIFYFYCLFLIQNRYLLDITNKTVISVQQSTNLYTQRFRFLHRLSYLHDCLFEVLPSCFTDFRLLKNRCLLCILVSSMTVIITCHIFVRCLRIQTLLMIILLYFIIIFYFYCLFLIQNRYLFDITNKNCHIILTNQLTYIHSDSGFYTVLAIFTIVYSRFYPLVSQTFACCRIVAFSVYTYHRRLSS